MFLISNKIVLGLINSQAQYSQSRRTLGFKTTCTSLERNFTAEGVLTHLHPSVSGSIIVFSLLTKL